MNRGVALAALAGLSLGMVAHTQQTSGAAQPEVLYGTTYYNEYMPTDRLDQNVVMMKVSLLDTNAREMSPILLVLNSLWWILRRILISVYWCVDTIFAFTSPVDGNLCAHNSCSKLFVILPNIDP